MKTRYVVYTALIGRYEELQDQPMALSSDADFICFTDDPTLVSATWRIHLVEPVFAMDSTRSARSLKVLGHSILNDYHSSLWIDARVVLKADPRDIIDGWLYGSDIALPRHGYRVDVVSEFDAVLVAGVDEHSRLYEQLTHYATEDKDLLSSPVPWTGMIARRRSPTVDRAMSEWWVHILRYSRRDQLSFVHALGHAATDFTMLDVDTHGSPVHEWRLGAGRSSRLPVRRMSESLTAPVAVVGELRADLESKNREMLSLVQAREERIAELEAVVAQQARRIRRLRGRVNDHHSPPRVNLLRRAARRVRRSFT